MPIAYFRWINSPSEDLDKALIGHKLQSTYMQRGKLVQSSSALWVFRLDNKNFYRPSNSISSSRILVKITFQQEAIDTIIENPNNHLNFEDESFDGEGKHPDKIIIKNNEFGARGIGCEVLKILNSRIEQIVEANYKEKKAAAS